MTEPRAGEIEQLLSDIGKSDNPDEAERWAREAVALAATLDVQRLAKAIKMLDGWHWREHPLGDGSIEATIDHDAMAADIAREYAALAPKQERTGIDVAFERHTRTPSADA